MGKILVGGENMKCPICGEKLQYKPYLAQNGYMIHIYSHDNTCPFIGFEYVDKEDLDGFIEYLKKQ
jgi:C4-type Zn-finger protein